MSKKSPKVRGSSSPIPTGPTGLDRRAFLGGSAALLLVPFAARGALADDAAAHEALPAATRALLGKSPYVYVSPLRKDGAESTCHGEVWYGWQRDAVYLVTSKDSWKSRALGRGLARARLWVGDHGRWKGAIFGTNEGFREAPSFDAKGSSVRDDDAFRALMKSYVGKYGTPFSEVWKGRMESGYADGSRVLLRYEPLPRT